MSYCLIYILCFRHWIPQRLNWKSFLAAPEDCTIKGDNLSKSKQWNKILYFGPFNNLFLNYFNTLLFKREGIYYIPLSIILASNFICYFLKTLVPLWVYLNKAGLRWIVCDKNPKSFASCYWLFETGKRTKQDVKSL